MQEVELQKLCAEAASHMRSLQGRNDRLSADLEKTASELTTLREERRAFGLAKLAAERGIITDDVSSVEQQAGEYRGANLDHIEAGLKMASGPEFLHKTADDEESPRLGGQNAIMRVLSSYL